VTYDSATSQIELTPRGSSGWQSPVPLASIGVFDPSNLRLVTGGAPALAIATHGGVQIARPTDGWTEHLITGGYGLLGIGYDASSHLYLILQGNYRSALPVAVFRER
jgi:hypothetical protein